MSSPTQADVSAASGVNLRGFIHSARAHGRWIGLILVGSVLLAVVYSVLQPARYEATALVLAEPLPLVSDAVAQPPLNVTTETNILTSYAVASAVEEDLGLSQDPDELLEDVTVSAPVGSEILEITFAHEDPEMASRGARSFATSYLLLRRKSALSNLEPKVAAIESRIELNEARVAEIDDEIRRLKRTALSSKSRQETRVNIAVLKPALAERAKLRSTLIELRGELEEVEPTRLLDLGVGTIIGPDTPPAEPVAPRPLRNLALALVLGLSIAAAVILIKLSLQTPSAAP